MKKPFKTVSIILLILNMAVLLGQLWPEGAPPFARTINILFLCGSLLFFIMVAITKTKE